MRRLLASLIATASLGLILCGCTPEVEIEETRSIRIAHEYRCGLDIETVLGNVRVRRVADQQDVMIRALVRASAEGELAARRRLAQIKVDVERHPEGRLVLGAHFPRGQRQGESVSFEVSASRFHDIHLRTMYGRVHLEDLTGPVRVDSASGSVRVRQHQGRVKVRTDSGSIRLDRVSGGVDLASRRGSIRVDRVVGEVVAVSEYGPVVYRAGKSNRNSVELRSVTGRVDAKLSPDMRGQLDCRSDRGRLRISSKLKKRARLREDTRHRCVLSFPKRGPRSQIKSEKGWVRVGL